MTCKIFSKTAASDKDLTLLMLKRRSEREREKCPEYELPASSWDPKLLEITEENSKVS